MDNKITYGLIGLGVVGAGVGGYFLWKWYQNQMKISPDQEIFDKYIKEGGGVAATETKPVTTSTPLNKNEKTYAGVRESEIEAFMASKFPSANVSKLMDHLRNGKVLRKDLYTNMTLKEFLDNVIKTKTVKGVFKTEGFTTPKAFVVGLLLGDAKNQFIIKDNEMATYYNLVRGL